MRERIDAIDATKGFLVLFMVIYHTFNYSTDYTLGFKCLPFLPLSFIIVTGFLIAKVYDDTAQRNRWHASGRLIERGCRLLLLFTLLNVATQLIGRNKATGVSLGVDYFFAHWFEVYVAGDSQIAAFSVLVPIAYLLVTAPIILWCRRVHVWLVIATAVALLSYIEWTSQRGDDVGLLALFSGGVVGYLAGQIPLYIFARISRYWFAPALAFLGFAQVRQYFYDHPIAQLIDACLALLWVFLACLHIEQIGWRVPVVVQLGRYSLLAYVTQIALLQMTVRIYGRVLPFSGAFYAELLLITVALVGLGIGMSLLRQRLVFADQMYRFVFG